MEEYRPDSVTVQLLKNGAVYDTVTLSAENNWRHSWTGLSDSATWKLIEVEVPEYYNASVELKGNTFVVTNSAEPEEIPENPIPEGNTPPTTDLEDPEIPLGGLPQTGTLWWAVPVLAMMGLLLCSAGYVVLYRGKKDGNA